LLLLFFSFFSFFLFFSFSSPFPPPSPLSPFPFFSPPSLLSSLPPSLSFSPLSLPLLFPLFPSSPSSFLFLSSFSPPLP
ncbi:hypothetical protein ACXWR7_13270, partial [Streptococcus pyogenes]